jgi:prepilin signal peptidase PulO-like enzyme (type II secretory pathway)
MRLSPDLLQSKSIFFNFFYNDDEKPAPRRFSLDFPPAFAYFLGMHRILPSAFHLPPGAFPFCVFLAFAVPISVIDIREQRIPDALSFPCFFLIAAARALFAPETLPLSLWAALAAFLLFALIRARAGGLGAGDLKLAAVMGLACSFPRVIAALFAASLLALAASLPLLIRAKNNAPAGNGSIAAVIPFAPFLCAGVILSYVGFFF